MASTIDYSRFMSEISLRREEQVLRKLYTVAIELGPEVSFLSAGLPSPEVFPVKSAEFEIDGEKEPLKISGVAMQSALQYGPTYGYPPLLHQMHSLTKRLHNPPRMQDCDVLMTLGIQDGLSKAIEMTVNPGDYVLTHDPMYSTVIGMMRLLKPKFLVMKEDSQGIDPNSLRDVLAPWDPTECRYKRDGVPKVLYINPGGSNPSGKTTSTERRKEIYKIACQYNLLLLEDDPYYFLLYDNEEPESFLSLDTECRVIRFDSFSKILSPGLRLGCAIGPKPLMERLARHCQTTVIHAAGISQVLVSELLKKWGEDGYLRRGEFVRQFYKEKRDKTMILMEKYLKGLCEWEVPKGGMFIWIKILNTKDSKKLVFEDFLKKKVVVAPGGSFFTDQSAPCPYIRLSFSMISEDEMEKALQKLAEALRGEF